MPLFDLPPRSDKISDRAIAKKAKSSKKAPSTVRGGGGIATQIANIKAKVNKELGKFEEETLIIRDELELSTYISKAIAYGEIAIDTETTGLDPLLDLCVGVCLYVPNEKTVYIPINHISYITMERIDNQLSEEVVAKYLKLLDDNLTRIIMFNAVFDIRVIKNQLGVRLHCYWDCKIASKLLNENEIFDDGSRRAGLKPLHRKYVLNGLGEAFSFDDLFDPKKIKFNLVPIREGGLYAAHDPKITWELYDFQRAYIYYEPDCMPSDRDGMNGVSWVFFNIEMPIVDVVVDMEDTGVALDLPYAKELRVKYLQLKEEAQDKVYEVLEEYEDSIEKYRSNNPDCKLDRPINLGSPQQLAVLLYDILGYPSVDKKKPRGTGKKMLKKWKTPLANALLEYKAIDKLLTFIIKIPDEHLNPNDKRVHGKFNQYGAKCITGDSLLLTDKGYISIGDIFSGDEPEDTFIEENVKVVNINRKFEESSHRIMYHDASTIKLKLRGGFSVEGTPHHPIVCSKLNKSDITRNKSDRQIKRVSEQCEFKKLEDIHRGDLVYVPFGYNIFPTDYQPTNLIIGNKNTCALDCKVPEYFTEDFAELLGMYFADGSIHDSNGSFKIRISNKDAEVRQRVAELVNKVFGLTVSERFEHTTIDTSFGSKRIECVYDILGRGAENKYIPKGIMMSPKSVVCAFIRGTTLDSSYAPNRQRLSISYYRKDSAEFVHQALANMGILSSLTLQNYSVGTRYRLSISGEYYHKFLNTVGVVQSSKKDMSKHCGKSSWLISDNGYFAYVNDIEYGVSDVYDLTVPNTHSFIACGIVNHNTGRFSSNKPNLQQIPSHNKDIRPMFKATDGETWVEEKDESFTVDRWCEVSTNNGWKYADKVNIGDTLKTDDGNIIVSSIIINPNSIVIGYKGGDANA